MSSESGAKSGAVGGDSAPIDPDLALIVNHWPNLSETVRQSIVAMVRAAAPAGNGC
ncbi:MAG: hypothetical protein ABSG67_13305 [Thermoguttaceae bacterium]